MRTPKSLIIIFAVLISLSGCVRDIDIVEPGQPSMLHLTMKSEKMLDLDTKGLIVTSESIIDHVIVFVFYSDGALVSRSEFTDMKDQDIINSYSVSGTGIKVCAVANYGLATELRDRLFDVNSFAELETLEHSMPTFDANSIEDPVFLPMVGELNNLDVLPGSNSFSIPMVYLVAKITVNVIDNTNNNNSVNEWRIVDAPKRSYYIDQATDCLDVSNDDDFFTSSWAPFDNAQIADSGNSLVAESFYVFENKRGGRRTDVSWPDDLPDYVRDSYMQKTRCAPAKATYFEFDISGNETPSDVSEFFGVSSDGHSYNLVMRVYLGANDEDDYNILRGHHYFWSIIINDAWDIDLAVTELDSNVSGFVVPLYSASSSTLNLDSHPDMRVINLKAKSNQVENLSIEINDSHNRSFYESGFDADWLKISPLNLQRSQISQTSPNNLWQQEASAAGHYVRGRFIPNKSRRMWLLNQASYNASFLDENGVNHNYVILPKAPTADYVSPGTYSPPSGITLGDSSSEYPDYDDALPWDKATYRMCYKLTDMIDISNSAEQAFEISVYADEYIWSGEKNNLQTSRYASVVVSFDDISVTPSQHRTINFLVQQQPPIYIGVIPDICNADSESRTLLMEKLEECIIFINPFNRFDLQNTQTMQWGYYGTNLYDCTASDRFLNGYFLTANAVYDDVDLVPSNPGTLNASHHTRDYTWSGSSYRQKFGSGSYMELTPATNYSLIVEPASEYVSTGTYGNTGAPYYQPNNRSLDPGSNGVFDLVYNSSAARYCHEKNMDIDGDGVISPWETNWYLPSQGELYSVFVSFEAILLSSTSFGIGSYWSSSESSPEEAYYLGFNTGYYKSGSNSKLMSSAASSSKRDGAARCVRQSDVITENSFYIHDNGNPALRLSSLNPLAYTEISKGSGTGIIGNNTVSGERHVSNNGATVFSNLLIAKHNLSTLFWNAAVGYPLTFPGAAGSGTVVAKADDRLGTNEIDLSGLSPNNVSAMGVPATEDTGCNGYYENADASDKGSWRLPTKRELMLMWIYQVPINETPGTDDFLSSSYWSSSERPMQNVPDYYLYCSAAWCVDFGTGHRVSDETDPSNCRTLNKNTNRRSRCVKELYNEILFRIHFHPNGGVKGPGAKDYYGDSDIVLPLAEGITHPDGKSFGGWNTRADGTGTTYAPGAPYHVGHDHTTLYAVWL